MHVTSLGLVKLWPNRDIKDYKIQTFDKGPTPPPPPRLGPLSGPQMHNIKFQNTPIFFSVYA